MTSKTEIIIIVIVIILLLAGAGIAIYFIWKAHQYPYGCVSPGSQDASVCIRVKGGTYGEDSTCGGYYCNSFSCGVFEGATGCVVDTIYNTGLGHYGDQSCGADAAPGSGICGGPPIPINCQGPSSDSEECGSTSSNTIACAVWDGADPPDEDNDTWSCCPGPVSTAYTNPITNLLTCQGQPKGNTCFADGDCANTCTSDGMGSGLCT